MKVKVVKIKPASNLIIERSSENGEISYLIRFNNHPIHKTINLPDARCSVNGAEVVCLDLFNLAVGLAQHFTKLSHVYDAIEVKGNGYRINLSKDIGDRVANCFVNIDFDQHGQIVSIEIV